MNAKIEDGEIEYKDQRISAGNIYYYAISAYNVRDSEGPKGPVIIVSYDHIRPAPDGLRATYNSRGIVLRWNAPTRPELSAYRVYRNSTQDLKKMEPIGRTRWAETFYVDEDVERDKPYYYTVRSMKMTGGIPIESAPSIMVPFTYPRAKIESPNGVRVVATSQGIRIVWDQVKSENETIRYNVYRSEGERASTRINRNALRKAWMTDTTVKKGKRYRYEVTAFPSGKDHEESRRTASEEITYK